MVIVDVDDAGAKASRLLMRGKGQEGGSSRSHVLCPFLRRCPNGENAILAVGINLPLPAVVLAITVATVKLGER